MILGPFISSSQIVPVIVLPSFLIPGSSGFTVLPIQPPCGSELSKVAVFHLPDPLYHCLASLHFPFLVVTVTFFI